MLHFLIKKKEKKERNHHHSQKQRQPDSHTGKENLAALQQPPKEERGLDVTSSNPHGFVTGDFSSQILPYRGRTPVVPRPTEICTAARGLISLGFTESPEL